MNGKPNTPLKKAPRGPAPAPLDPKEQRKRAQLDRMGKLAKVHAAAGAVVVEAQRDVDDATARLSAARREHERTGLEFRTALDTYTAD